MRIITACFFITVLILGACYSLSRKESAGGSVSMPNAQITEEKESLSRDKSDYAIASGDAARPIPASAPLQAAASAQAATQAFDRKIIRNANLDIEHEQPNDAQRKISAIAETHGGFVVNTESKLNTLPNAPANLVTIVVRVPAAQFNAAIEKIRGVGGRILQEKITGQDVTEEYIDLEARLRTQKALEAQMLELLKRAAKISDALEVQGQIATVRTEIERLEGRRRFLENQSALSTINITLHTPAPVVMATTAHGFWHEVKQSFGNGIDLASGIVLGIIQLVLVLIPVLLLIVLPLFALYRLLRKRLGWPKPAATVAESAEASGND